MRGTMSRMEKVDRIDHCSGQTETENRRLMSRIFFKLKTHEQKDGDDIQVEVYVVWFAYILM